jgi:lambda repressor-like predicted transcriptional regulator
MPGTGCGNQRHCVAGCLECQRVSRFYDRRRRARIAAGTWLPNVPVEQVIAHVDRLVSGGMSVNAIARASGVSSRTLQDLRLRSYMFGATAKAVFAVRPSGPSLPAGFVPGIGTARRVRALMALGWSLSAQSREVGMHIQQLWELAWEKQSYVSEATDRRVRDLFERLSATPGKSTRSRNAAREHGWPPPLAWDDIDDPDAEPSLGESRDDIVDEVAMERALSGHHVDLTDAELVAVLQAGVARGEPLSKLSLRLGVNYAGTKKLVGGELTPQRAKRARVEEELRRLGDKAPDWEVAALLGVHHSTVRRARERLAAAQGAA